MPWRNREDLEPLVERWIVVTGGLVAQFVRMLTESEKRSAIANMWWMGGWSPFENSRDGGLPAAQLGLFSMR